MSNEKDPVLCYVKSPWAYFTTRPLNEQWGDDCKEITKVAFEIDVEMINAGAVPWLRTSHYDSQHVYINAGTPLSKFIELIQQRGGKIYQESKGAAKTE